MLWRHYMPTLQNDQVSCGGEHGLSLAPNSYFYMSRRTVCYCYSLVPENWLKAPWLHQTKAHFYEPVS